MRHPKAISHVPCVQQSSCFISAFTAEGVVGSEIGVGVNNTDGRGPAGDGVDGNDWLDPADVMCEHTQLGHTGSSEIELDCNSIQAIGLN